MRITIALSVTLLTACSMLAPPERVTKTMHLLEPALASATSTADGPTIVVAPLRAAPGYTGTAMLYRIDGHGLERFAENRWAETPARMLQPMVVRALEADGAFSAVLTGPSAGIADLRLDIEISRMRQEVAGDSSRVSVVLRAELVVETDGRVLLAHDFEAGRGGIPADPTSGARAIQAVLDTLLSEVAVAVADAAHSDP